MATTTYDIPVDNLDKLTGEIARLTKRALRLGLTPPVLTIGELHERVVVVNPDTDEKRVIVWRDVTLTSEPIKLAGWTFLGAIDHADEGNILRAVPGHDLAVAYRGATAHCDHCGLDRKRNTTFITLHEDGREKQIGRNCLADFLGVDPAKAAKDAEYAAIFGELLGSAEDDGWGGGGGNSKYLLLDGFLAWVALSVRLDGWVSRATARDKGGASTVDLALNREEERSKNGKGERPSDADRAQATAAIEWARGLGESGAELNDYEYNLTTVCKGLSVSLKHLGIAASVITAYERAQGRERERKFAAVTSAHFGTPKKRAEYTLTVTGTHSFPGYAYNTTRWLIRFRDEHGNVATWWTGDEGLWSFKVDGTILKDGLSDDIKGRTYAVKATVKAHEDFKGTKQTVLTRVAVLDDVTVASTRDLSVSNLV